MSHEQTWLEVPRTFTGNRALTGEEQGGQERRNGGEGGGGVVYPIYALQER